MNHQISLQNPWWSEPKYQFPLPDYTKRAIDEEFSKTYQTDKMISLSGLRQTGKTTILKKTINNLLKKVPARQIFYANFESSFGVNKEDLRAMILDFIENIARARLHHAENLHMFFDEIQYIENWQDILKFFYEINPSIKFVITGSSNLYLQKGRVESLLGRIVDLTVHPFSFAEYLKLIRVEFNPDFNLTEFLLKPGMAELSNLEIAAAPVRKLLVQEYANYLHFGNFPGSLTFPDIESRNKYINESIYVKSVNVDIPQIFGIAKKYELAKLLEVFIYETGIVVEINNLAAEIGLDKNTVYSYIEALEETKLIGRLPKYQKSRRLAKGASAKYYAASPNFTCALQNISSLPNLLPMQIGFLVETDVFWRLKQIFPDLYYFAKPNNEIDFRKEQLFVEVKYRNRINFRDFRFFVEQMKQNKIYNGFILTKDLIKRHTVKADGRIYTLWFLPAWAM